jgi:hypothetical protein
MRYECRVSFRWASLNSSTDGGVEVNKSTDVIAMHERDYRDYDQRQDKDEQAVGRVLW